MSKLALPTNNLTIGEWRLFLLSDCIKQYPEVDEITRDMRKDRGIIELITQEDVNALGAYINKGVVSAIRGQLHAEWDFTGKVMDNGRNNHTTCEYCQRQEIRYRYLCLNKITRVWLSLGSVCVGNVVYGEERMRDEAFSKDFTKKLDDLRKDAKPEGKPEPKPDPVPAPSAPRSDEQASKREEQQETIKVCMKFLRQVGQGSHNNTFLAGLQKRWETGLALSDGQLTALLNTCTRHKKKLLEDKRRAEQQRQEAPFGYTLYRCSTCYETYGKHAKIEPDDPDEYAGEECPACKAVDQMAEDTLAEHRSNKSKTGRSPRQVSRREEEDQAVDYVSTLTSLPMGVDSAGNVGYTDGNGHLVSYSQRVELDIMDALYAPKGYKTGLTGYYKPNPFDSLFRKALPSPMERYDAYLLNKHHE